MRTLIPLPVAAAILAGFAGQFWRRPPMSGTRTIRSSWSRLDREGRGGNSGD